MFKNMDSFKYPNRKSMKKTMWNTEIGTYLLKLITGSEVRVSPARSSLDVCDPPEPAEP